MKLEDVARHFKTAHIYMSVTVIVTLRWVVLLHVHQLPQPNHSKDTGNFGLKIFVFYLSYSRKVVTYKSNYAMNATFH
jgi:hypothetical protein